MKSIGIVDLILCGGEPLLRDDLPDIVRKASELKFDRIHIITNGLLLTRDRLEQLVERGLTSVYISLNGNENLHDMTRGIKGAYIKTMDALKTLVELRASRFPQLEINVLTIVMELNLSDIIDITRMCRQWGVRLSLSPLNISHPWQEPTSAELRPINQDQLDHVIEELHVIKGKSPSLIHNSHAALEYVRKYFADRKREDIPCYLGYLEICLGPHGEVSPGCWALPPIGNITQASLKQIMCSKIYRERVRNMFLKRCPGCACDYVFNLYAHSPSLAEEIKWRLRLAWEKLSTKVME
jgi:MoaA/NifB/PqqE/SkfB family radical SAM enzyme